MDQKTKRNQVQQTNITLTQVPITMKTIANKLPP